MATKVAKLTRFTPIMRLENGTYTRAEWVCILQHSIIRNFEDGLYLQYEHLSKERLRQSLLYGLEEVGCEDLRPEIWKLICKVQNSKLQYSSGVFKKFLLEENPHGDYRIEKDLYRTLPGNKEFMSPSKGGKNRLFNVLKAY